MQPCLQGCMPNKLGFFFCVCVWPHMNIFVCSVVTRYDKHVAVWCTLLAWVVTWCSFALSEEGRGLTLGYSDLRLGQLCTAKLVKEALDFLFFGCIRVKLLFQVVVFFFPWALLSYQTCELAIACGGNDDCAIGEGKRMWTLWFTIMI